MSTYSWTLTRSPNTSPPSQAAPISPEKLGLKVETAEDGSIKVYYQGFLLRPDANSQGAEFNASSLKEDVERIDADEEKKMADAMEVEPTLPAGTEEDTGGEEDGEKEGGEEERPTDILRRGGGLLPVRYITRAEADAEDSMAELTRTPDPANPHHPEGEPEELTLDNIARPLQRAMRGLIVLAEYHVLYSPWRLLGDMRAVREVGMWRTGEMRELVRGLRERVPEFDAVVSRREVEEGRRVAGGQRGRFGGSIWGEEGELGVYWGD